MEEQKEALRKILTRWIDSNLDVGLTEKEYEKFLNDLEKALVQLNQLIDSNEEEAKKQFAEIKNIPLIVYLNLFKLEIDKIMKFDEFRHRGKNNPNREKFKRMYDLIENTGKKIATWNNDMLFDPNKKINPKISDRLFGNIADIKIEKKEKNGIEYPAIIISYLNTSPTIYEGKKIEVSSKTSEEEYFLYIEDKEKVEKATKAKEEVESERLKKEFEDEIREFFIDGKIPQEDCAYHPMLIKEINESYKKIQNDYETYKDGPELCYYYISVQINTALRYYWDEIKYKNNSLAYTKEFKEALAEIKLYKKKLKEIKEQQEESKEKSIPETMSSDQTPKKKPMLSQVGSFLSRLIKGPRTSGEEFGKAREEEFGKMKKRIEELEERVASQQEEIERLKKR